MMNGEQKISPQAQQLVMQLQQYQQQMQLTAVQKENLTIQKISLERAIEEIEKAPDGEEVYKAVGPILIRSKKASLKDELKEKLSTLDARLGRIEAQEKKLRDKATEIQKKLQESLGA